MKGVAEYPQNRVNLDTVALLVILHLLGNLAVIPLHQSTGVSEPFSVWIIWTLVSVPFIWLAMQLSTRVGLGTPIIEGVLPKEDRRNWALNVTSYTLLGTIIVLPAYIWINQGISSFNYPPAWQLILASVQAGVREEIFNRLFLMSLIIWTSHQITRKKDTSAQRQYWVGNLISAIIFGIAHVDNTVYSPELFVPLLVVFTANMFLGLLFGWLFWRFGIEAAMLSHFMFDALGSVLLIPVFLWGDPVPKTITLILLLVTGYFGLRFVRKR